MTSAVCSSLHLQRFSTVRRKSAAPKKSVVVRAYNLTSSTVDDDHASRRQVIGTGLAAALAGFVPLEARAVESPAALAAAAKGENFKNPSDLGDGFRRLYGEATSASSYGGYGGNENNFEKFKYYYDVPNGWTADTINKTQKATNGTDTRWINPKLPAEKVYCVTLTGYNKLKEDRSELLGDLALSDYDLQDAIQGADVFEVAEREAYGQTYIDFDLYGYFGAIYACVTVYGGRFYALFSLVPESALEQNKEQAKRIRNSFGTISKDDEQTQYDLEFYKRS